MIRTTRTYTRWFSDERLELARKAARELREDWESRRMFVDAEDRHRGDDRLRLLEAAIELLGERV